MVHTVYPHLWGKVIEQTQQAERKAKQRKDDTDKARERQTYLQAKAEEGAKPSDKGTVPAKERKATQKRKLCEYICPHCGESVTSTVQTGQVDHRRRCGNRFRAKDERIVAKAYVYMCPFCNGESLSNTKTGQIDHRSVCGNKIFVKEGRVSEGARRHAHSCPVCQRSFGEVHVSVCLSLSLCPSVRPSVRASIGLSVCLPVCLRTFSGALPQHPAGVGGYCKTSCSFLPRDQLLYLCIDRGAAAAASAAQSAFTSAQLSAG